MKQSKPNQQLEIKSYLKVFFKNYAKSLAFFVVSVISYSILFLLMLVLLKYRILPTLFSSLFLFCFVALIVLPFYKNPIKDELSGKHIFDLVVKRIVDLFFSLSMTITFLPAGIFICIFIKLDSRGPVLIRQKRLGLYRRIFDLYKFRTSTYIDSNHGVEITRAGRFLIRTGLDEIPQLFNVLLGDMSLVGPRILKPEAIDSFRKGEYRRFSFPPGITGLWQFSVLKVKDVSNKDLFKLDLCYVDNWSLINDMKILLKTAEIVMFKS